MKEDRKPKDDSHVEPEDATAKSRTVPLPPDPADVVPVPGAMSAAEIDERAKVVESLRDERDARERELRQGESKPVDEPRRGGNGRTGDKMEEP